MLQAFYHEAPVQVGDDTLRLTLDFGAMDAIEGQAGRPFDAIVKDLTEQTATMSLQARVVWGLLRRHHPEISLEQAASLLFGNQGAAVGLVIGKLLSAAFASGEEVKTEEARPRKPRGASNGSSSRGAQKA